MARQAGRSRSGSGRRAERRGRTRRSRLRRRHGLRGTLAPLRRRRNWRQSRHRDRPLLITPLRRSSRQRGTGGRRAAARGTGRGEGFSAALRQRRPALARRRVPHLRSRRLSSVCPRLRHWPRLRREAGSAGYRPAGGGVSARAARAARARSSRGRSAPGTWRRCRRKRSARSAPVGARADRDDTAAHRAARPHASRRHLGRIDAEDRPAFRAADVHRDSPIPSGLSGAAEGSSAS